MIVSRHAGIVDTSAIKPAETLHVIQGGSGTINGAAGAYLSFPIAFTSIPFVVASAKDALGVCACSESCSWKLRQSIEEQ